VATYYCATTIEAEKEAKVLLAAGCSGQMVVWHDGRMVARGPGGVLTPDIPNETLLFHVNLHPGANRLLVRCDAEAFGLFTHRIPGSASYFWMRACRRGAPADPASSREWLARVEARKKDLPNLPPGTQGFRYDQTGYYAGADPVTVWDLERGINVRWIAPLERWSKGSPIVVGNRVFAQADPHVLVCLDAATGKVLWRRASNVLETMDPKLHQESEALHAKFLEAKAAAAPALAALGPDYAARLRALAAQGKPLPQAVVDLRGMEHEAHKAYGAFFGHLQQHAKLSSPPWEGAYSGNYVGYTFATPVTDGRRVFVKCGTGVVAAYDLDGNRLWMARTPYLASGAHFCGSPVLADDLVVIAQIQDPNAGQFSDWLFTLTALDAATGKVRWTGKAHEGGRQSSSPVVMRLTNGGEDMTVIVTAGGTVVRAADGKILVNGLRGGCGTATPTPVGDTLYRIESGQAGGVRFLMLDRDHVGARWLWSANRRYNALYAGVGHRDGILFGLGHGGSQCLGGRALDLIDVVTGTKLERPFNAELKKEGIYACPSEGYIPPVASARHLYVAVRGQRHASSLREELPDRWKPWAYVSVLQWGVKGRFVAHNQVPAQLTPHPALAGDAVFLRNEEELMCFGYTGDEGRAYEAEVNAATLLADIEPAAPTDPAGAALWREGVERARSYLQKVIELRPASEAATRAKALLAQVATPR
jgi:outer membrane protein assembly factor BamB